MIPIIGWGEIARIRATSRFFANHWDTFKARNKVRVPEDFATFDQAQKICFNLLCLEKQYTPTSPLIIKLGFGIHTIENSWTSSFSNDTYASSLSVPVDNIVFEGTGTNKTTLHGQLVVDNNHKGIHLKNLNMSSNNGSGLYLRGGAHVTAEDCTFTKCKISGLFLTSAAQCIMKRCEFSHNEKAGCFVMNQETQAGLIDCEFHNNETEGLLVYDEGTCNIYGEDTISYDNKSHGLSCVIQGKINIFLSKLFCRKNLTRNNLGKKISTKDKLLDQIGGTVCYFAPNSGLIDGQDKDGSEDSEEDEEDSDEEDSDEEDSDEDV